jgi:L-lysine 2,3-aminomutase
LEQIKVGKRKVNKVKPITKIEQLQQLSEQERAELKEVASKFDFRVSDYYLSLIDWGDPNDPIRHIVIPNAGELEEWGRLDPSDEKRITVMPGLEHKYHSVILFLVTNQCEGICRYCFRKRIFIKPEMESVRDGIGSGLGGGISIRERAPRSHERAADRRRPADSADIKARRDYAAA